MFRDNLAKIRYLIEIALFVIVGIITLKGFPIVSIALFSIALIKIIIYMIASKSKRDRE